MYNRYYTFLPVFSVQMFTLTSTKTEKQISNCKGCIGAFVTLYIGDALFIESRYYFLGMSGNFVGLPRKN